MTAIPRGSRERERAGVVLEQHERGGRRFAREGAMTSRAVLSRGPLDIHVGMLEQAQLELDAQHARNRRVDDGRRNESALECVEVRPLLAVRGLKNDVEAGIEGVGCRRRRAGFRQVQDGRAAGAGRVRNHEPRKRPVALEHVGEQMAILRRGRSVHGVVGRHDRSGAGADRSDERRVVALHQRALAVINRIAVAPAFADVRHEMLGRSHDAERARTPRRRYEPSRTRDTDPRRRSPRPGPTARRRRC